MVGKKRTHFDKGNSFCTVSCNVQENYAMEDDLSSMNKTLEDN